MARPGVLGARLSRPQCPCAEGVQLSLPLRASLRRHRGGRLFPALSVVEAVVVLGWGGSGALAPSLPMGNAVGDFGAQMS